MVWPKESCTKPTFLASDRASQLWSWWSLLSQHIELNNWRKQSEETRAALWLIKQAVLFYLCGIQLSTVI